MVGSLDEFQMGPLETGVSTNLSWILFNNFRLIIYPNISLVTSSMYHSIFAKTPIISR